MIIVAHLTLLAGIQTGLDVHLSCVNESREPALPYDKTSRMIYRMCPTLRSRRLNRLGDFSMSKQHGANRAQQMHWTQLHRPQPTLRNGAG